MTQIVKKLRPSSFRWRSAMLNSSSVLDQSRRNLASDGVPPGRALGSCLGSGAIRVRAFTLTELMVVVVIIGILASLGVAGVRQKMRQAKRVEVVSGLQEIAKAQDRFRAEHGVFLNVSPDLATYYPPLVAGQVANFWGHTGEGPWRELGPELPQLVSFSYSTVAGLPFSDPPALDPDFESPPAWPASSTLVEPWYVVGAKGADKGSTGSTVFFMSSFDTTIHEQDNE
ncbi:MAG TPA: prepilin-type N-terminal cleavage/methylation domain-containing protein [Polyangiaceae bacterium]|nr:prepilin-type N-terminal cleavage/methylation domain-containing protein [Polyangiaceae bacterium]